MLAMYTAMNNSFLCFAVECQGIPSEIPCIITTTITVCDN